MTTPRTRRLKLIDAYARELRATISIAWREALNDDRLGREKDTSRLNYLVRLAKQAGVTQ